MKVISNNTEDTKRIAKDFGENIKGGETILLNGDLGAGKTTFTQFLLKQLGVNDVVASPTFAILKSYKGDFIFHHFDTYRITTEEAIEAGFDEILSEKDSVKIIEWSENIAELLPDSRIVINITTIDETKREIEIIYE